MKVIINADDFGSSAKINLEIEKAIIAHRISSTTIIANSPFFEDAIKISKKYNQISYGVHLNLIEFAPLTNVETFKKYKLVGDDGMFINGAIFNINDFTEEFIFAIKEEWRKQIGRVFDYGINVSHIDSHQHTHAIPALEGVVIDLLEEFKIPCVRRQFYESIPLMLRERSYKKPLYKSINTDVKQSMHKDLFIVKLWKHLVVIPYRHHRWIDKMKCYAKMTDDVFVYQVFIQEVKRKYKKYQDLIIEVECHPGLETNKEETIWLMTDKLREIVSNYQLINFYKL